MATSQTSRVTRVEVTEADSFARQYYDRLVNGQVGAGEPFPEESLQGWAETFKPPYQVYCIDLEGVASIDDESTVQAVHTRAAENAKYSFNMMRSTHKQLDTLLSAVIEVDDEEETSTVDVPALPSIANVDYSKGKSARTHLDEWIKFIAEDLPAVHRLHAEGVGLFLYSALLGRRVVIHGTKQDVYPILYMSLTSSSGVGKSSVAKKAILTLRKLFLEDKLVLEGPDYSPNWLVRQASGKVTDEYEGMDDDRREEEQANMSYYNGKAWYWDEGGMALLRMGSGQNTQDQKLLALLLSWYSGFGTGQGSITNGTDKVREVYMPLLMCMTISNGKALQKNAAQLFGNGTMGRIANLCIAKRPWEDIDLGYGEERVPGNILNPLKRLHDFLGEPDVKIIEKAGKRGGAPSYKIERTLKETVINISPTAHKLYNNYFNAIGRLCDNSSLVPPELDPSYRRLPEYMIKIAALLCCVDNGCVMEDRHMIAAQEIVERWRAALHEFYAQVFEPEESKDRKTEDRVLTLIKKASAKSKWLSISDIHRGSKLAHTEIARIVDALESRHIIFGVSVKNPRKKDSPPTLKYALPETPLPAHADIPKEDTKE